MIEKDSIIILRVSAEEKEYIRQKMKEAGMRNMSAFIRKMAINGYCISLDLSDVKKLVSLMGYCSNNLNQYAKRANETGSIYQDDILDVKNRMDTIWEELKELLTRLASI